MNHALAHQPLDGAPRGVEDLYEALGGTETLERLTRAFYDRVERDPVLRPLFRKNLAASRDRLTLFLTERLGGPRVFSPKSCPANLLMRHADVLITSKEAHAWLDHMSDSIAELGLPEALSARLSRYMLDEALTLESPLCDYKGCSLDELRHGLQKDPSLVSVQDGLGQTLLHYAVMSWDLDRVRLLLSFGAAVGEDGAYLLYRAANHLVPADERGSEVGRAIAELLLEAGADVNAGHSVGRQTPLHMAARRGNLAVAEVLLAAGADPNRPDKDGETPLRRAVNCGHPELARRLLKAGADPHRPDKKGMTPLQAAQRTGKAPLLALFGEA